MSIMIWAYDAELRATYILLKETVKRNLNRFLDDGEGRRYVPLDIFVNAIEIGQYQPV
ncbi:hypothetical protein Metev_0175 [Methanohalobium evestigatum Z-7303]|uniref:Uncharacterized protein n=1 Tax=Methanohalobium evestigatum (strain ATCC BAA-1072 / DSM 3721 / NBRC 107634 / OCM 161 / Z-7303) TaxID=644295 RepID=D7E684_METEZ|nr:hypothetical protein [Methanohalobium evestigatum]ADI73106.1 hypothetical protein Metev_0175 [Methanohalobium evestigatum Z-7303]